MDEKFADLVYENVKEHKYFITNLGKCTQVDARVLPNSVYSEYLDLLCKEIEIINPKIIITLGNQISSIVLNQNVTFLWQVEAPTLLKIAELLRYMGASIIYFIVTVICLHSFYSDF